MKVTYKCLPENESRGHSVKISLKKEVIRCGLQKMGSFLIRTLENGGHLLCKNAISSPNLQILCYYRKICKFLKMPAKRANICNLNVKFDTKVEKKGHCLWIEGKRGAIGCMVGVKMGSIDRHLIIHRQYGSAGGCFCFYYCK